MKKKKPIWAENLIYEISYDFHIPYPKLAWGRSKDWYPFGRSFSKCGIIGVFAGKNHLHTKCVLIHEITHWIRYQAGDIRGSHDKAFYLIVEKLYRKYHIPRLVAMDREGIFPQHWDLPNWGNVI